MVTIFLKKSISLLVLIGICLSIVKGNENDSIDVNRHKEPLTIFRVIQAKEVPTITIEADLSSIVADKKTNNRHPATLTYSTENGKVFQKSIELKPRGRSRRNYCDFPPLQIRFSKQELRQKGISTNHKKLKLVTHCLDGYAANPNVLKEYLAYKIYNELTPKSLNVQLLKTRYTDTNSGGTQERYAILLEDIDELADRMQGKEIEGFNYKYKDLETEDKTIFTLFQYLIGNEDWELAVQRNIKLIQTNRSKKLIPIPYDFDSSGLVATTYAKPNRDYQMKSVQQRLFMGKFSNKKDRQRAILFFNTKKDKIYQLIDNLEELDVLVKLEVKAYLDSFYEILNTPKLMNRALPTNGKKPAISDMEGKIQVR